MQVMFVISSDPSSYNVAAFSKKVYTLPKINTEPQSLVVWVGWFAFPKTYFSGSMLVKRKKPPPRSFFDEQTAIMCFSPQKSDASCHPK